MGKGVVVQGPVNRITETEKRFVGWCVQGNERELGKRESGGFVLILERAFSLLFWHWLRSAVDCVTVLNKQPVNGIPNTIFCWRDTTILAKIKLVTSVKSISVKNI